MLTAIVDIEVEGSLAYIAEDKAPAKIIDVRDPRHPVVLAPSLLRRPAHTLALGGGFVYLATEPNTLEIVDVHVPDAPRRVGQYMLPGYVGDVAADGALAYVTGGDGLHIIEAREDAAPTRLALYPSSRGATSVQLFGGTLYVRSMDEGMCRLDIGDPTAPRRLACFPWPPDRPIEISGTMGYGTDGTSLHVIDLGDPLALNQQSVPLASWSSGVGVQVVGGRLYVAADEAGLQILELRPPAVPRQLGSFDTPARAVDVQVVGTTAYVADVTSVQIIAVGDLANLSLLARIDFPPGAHLLQVAGNRLYVAGYQSTSVQVFDVRTPARPVLLGEIFTNGVSSLAVDGPYLYLTGSDTSSVYDVRDPSTITQIAAYHGGDMSDGESPLIPSLIQTVDPYAYMIAGRPGHARLQILDVRDPARPQTLGAAVISRWNYYRIRVVGTMVYLVGMEGIEAVDVADPAAPSVRWSTSAGAFDAQANGDWLYAGTQGAGVAIYWLGAGAAP
jgi:hypothetical protein